MKRCTVPWLAPSVWRQVLLTSLSCVLAAAQPDALKFEHISLDRGLSQATVNSIAQDGQGFIWFGTQDGLNQYDGYSMRVFRHDIADSTSISDNSVWSLMRDRNGDLWIGTMRGGLNHYSMTLGKFSAFKHSSTDSSSISSNNVTSVLVDSRGIVWAGTLGAGLNRLDPSRRRFEKFIQVSNNDSTISDNIVWAICEDIQGNIWIGTWNGLCRYIPPDSTGRPGHFVRYRHDPGNPNTPSANEIRTLCADANGGIWIGTWGGGLDRLIDSTIKHFTVSSDPKSLSSNLILSLFEDSRRNIWVGTGDAGLNMLPHGSNAFQRYRKEHEISASLNDDIVCAILEDDGGSIWAGTAAGGVNRYNAMENRFPHYRVDNNRSDDQGGNDVWAILEDSRGTLWVGTHGNGLNRFSSDRQSVTRYRHRLRDGRSISSDFILCLLETRSGHIWIGTEGGGVNRLDPASGVFTRFVHDPQNTNTILQNEVTALCEDRDGNIWIGTNGSGLSRYDQRSGRFVHYRPDDSHDGTLTTGAIMSLLEDYNGDMWVGTYDGGLLKHNRASDKFTAYEADRNNSHGLSNNTVLSLYQDSAGLVWVGTYGGGLDVLDPATERFRVFTESDGLPNNVVYGVLPDDHDNLWLSTNKGLARFSPATLSCTTYDVQDGLQGNEFNQGAYHRSRRGELFFGGINGLNAFVPDSVSVNAFVPPVYLRAVTIFGPPLIPDSALSATRRIILAPDQNFFLVEFVALSYVASSRNKYSYMLQGLDPSWIDAGTRRYASYTNLDPGEYILRIRGSNADGVWNEQGTAVNLVVLPPYWKTVWFRGLVLLVIAGGLVGLYRIRINKLLEIERLRTAIATDLHDDIGSTLTEIALFSDAGSRMLQRHNGHSVITKPEIVRMHGLLADTGSTARGLIDAMNDIVWAVDPKNDSFEFLLLRIKSHASRVLEAKGINYEFDIPPELSRLHLPLAFRRLFFLIFKEAMNNVIRHARANTVRLSILRNASQLAMQVADDGVGFDPERMVSGNGLRNMYQRAKSLGGSLVVTSRPDHGAVVSLTVNMP